jgi:hypothetical protein
MIITGNYATAFMPPVTTTFKNPVMVITQFKNFRPFKALLNDHYWKLYNSLCATSNDHIQEPSHGNNSVLQQKKKEKKRKEKKRKEKKRKEKKKKNNQAEDCAYASEIHNLLLRAQVA